MWEHVLGGGALVESLVFLGVGLIFSGFGCLAISDFLLWRRIGTPVTGTVVGVRESRNSGSRGTPVYHEIIEYTASDGSRVQAETGVGSSGLSRKIPGTPRHILVRKDKPHEVRVIGPTFLLLGLGALVPGLVMLWMAVLNGMPFVVVAGLVGVVLMVVFMCYTQSQNSAPYVSKTSHAGSSDVPATVPERWRDRDVHRQNGRFLDRDRILALAERQKKTNKSLSPLFLIIGVGVMWGGFHTGFETAALIREGHRVPGIVTHLEAVYSDGSNSYFPHVRFTGLDGRIHDFRSNAGSNPPMYEKGEQVTVLYRPEATEKAMIDHGIWNWALPAGLGAGGLIFVLVALSMLFGRAGEKRRAL